MLRSSFGFHLVRNEVTGEQIGGGWLFLYEEAPDRHQRVAKKEKVMTGKPSAIRSRMIIGLFLITSTTLMFEILLTRIFSVTMWYHFAFMAISIALFGMTLGSLSVYLAPSRFSQDQTRNRMAEHSLLFSVSMVVAILFHINFPPDPNWTIMGIVTTTATFLIIAIPFFFSGITVTLAFTRFATEIGGLYAADLAGAACGCLCLRYMLEFLTGPMAMIAIAALAAIGAWMFAIDATQIRLKRLSLTMAILLAALIAIDATLMRNPRSLLPLKRVKNRIEEKLQYEKWNSFARVAVRAEKLNSPFGWGLSDRLPPMPIADQHYMDIDATAGTVLTRYQGDPATIDYLKYDITNLAYYLNPPGNVMIVGVGGGRDVLSALCFKQKAITGVEINRNIVNMFHSRFADFTGHLDRDPRIRIIPEEARSHLSRTRKRFDLIQISLIDTWAATSAGAFVLAENSLYTVEAWDIFLKRLNPKGILTVSRWYLSQVPGEMHRLAVLACEALKKNGIREPRRHILIARRMLPRFQMEMGIGTMLISPEPFSGSQVDQLQEICRRFDFETILTPTFSRDISFVEITTPHLQAPFIAAHPLNISAPTDNSPFFFQTLRIRDAFRPRLWKDPHRSFNLKAVSILGLLLLIVIVLSLVCFFIPLILRFRSGAAKGAYPFFLYFIGIGFGFMLIEISQMQRLTVFLGHPNYGLTVVLFTLLLGGSMGSLFSRSVYTRPSFPRTGVLILALLILFLSLFGWLTPMVTVRFSGIGTFGRIALAFALLFPAGVLMGTALPMGLHLAAQRRPAITPWLLGINGAASVTASVLAIFIAMAASISTAFWCGLGCYGITVLSMLRMKGKPDN